MAFALSSGESRVGELRWSKVGGSLAIGETAESSWTFKRAGFLNPQVTVRPVAQGSSADVARITAHLNYHRIELRGGRMLRFHRAGYLIPAWTVSLEDGRELLHIEPVREGRRLVGGAVIATPLGAEMADFALIAIAGWYFIVLAWFEDEALVPFEGPSETGSPPSSPASVSAGSRGPGAA